MYVVLYVWFFMCGAVCGHVCVVLSLCALWVKIRNSSEKKPIGRTKNPNCKPCHFYKFNALVVFLICAIKS